MDWKTLASVVTAGATSIYTFLFSIALWFAYVQTSGFEKNRKFQSALNIFEKLQTSELIIARRYMYESFPENIEGIDPNQLILLGGLRRQDSKSG